MLQVLRKGLKEIVIEEVPEPSLGHGEVKIKTAYSLISSGTEIAGLHSEGLAKEVIRERERISTMIGRAVKEQGIIKTAQAILDKFKELSITGYSGAGVIIEKSPDIKDLDLGQRVAYGGVQTGHAEVVCAPRNLVVPVPDGVDLKEASLATVGSIALHAVRNAEISIGDSIAVIGLGLIGQLVVQLAKIAGARVFGIDLKKERLNQAIKQGAEIALHAKESPQIVLNTMTNGQGVDAVIVCASSKTSEPLDLALHVARSRATIVVVGAVKMEMDREVVYRKELRVSVSRSYGPGSYDPVYEKKGIDYPIDYVRWTENRNMAEFIRLLEQKRIQSRSIITHEFLLEEAPLAYQELASADSGIIGAVLRYPDLIKRNGVAGTTLSLIERATKATTPKGRLRVGIIGLGNIARWVHLPNVDKHPKLILRGVCTSKGYVAKHLGRRYKSEYCSTDYRKIIEDPEIDVVMICTRHNLHAPLALEALSRGKHVFVEKPMAMTREECRNIIRLVKETGLGFMVNFNRRYSRVYHMAKKAVLGKGQRIISVRMNSPDIMGSSWVMDPVEGGGAILGEGCHFFDLMAWFADSEPVSVYAQKLFLPHDAVTSRNNISCVLSFEDGSVGNLVYQTLGHRGVGSERVEISSGGSTAVVENARRLWIWDGFFPRSKKSLRPEKGYYQFLDAFVDGVLKGERFEKEAIAGANATLSALAALKSLESGLPEKVEKIGYTSREGEIN